MFSSADSQGQAGGGGDTIHIPHAHKGWADLQRSLNRDMMPALHDSHRTVDAALRTLARARKVLG